MRSLLIIGANRGLGLELVKQFVTHPTSKPEILIATARKPSEAKDLQELASKYNSLYILPLDVTQFDSFGDFSDKVSGIVGEQGLNVVFNNAGILLDKFGKLEAVTPESLTTQFLVNTVAPIILTQALLPLVKKAAKSRSGGISVDKAALFFMSAVTGSIKNNEGAYAGGCWGYRESKAALNMAARTICKEVSSDGIGVLVLHPGWVKTDMGGPNAPLSPTMSVHGLIRVIFGLSEKKNGSFIQHDGTQLPW